MIPPGSAGVSPARKRRWHGKHDAGETPAIPAFDRAISIAFDHTGLAGTTALSLCGHVRTQIGAKQANERTAHLRFLPFWEYYANVRVIAKRSLKAFWERPGCGDAQAPLSSWHEEASRAQWKTPHSIKAQFATARIVGRNRVVFNVGGNKYRLVVEMQYRAGIAWVRFVGTHADYDRINVETVNDY